MDRQLAQRAKRRMAAVAFTLLRTYMRYSPIGAGKPWLYEFARRTLDYRRFKRIVRTRHGLKFECSSHDAIQAHLMYFGLWEVSLTNVFARLLHPGDVVIDIGSNIGYFTLLASKLVGPTGRVIAVDASPNAYAALLRNVRLNGAGNVRAYNVAIAGERGTVTIYHGREGNEGSASIYRHEGRAAEATVDALPLAELLEPADLASARLIKIDVEGAEPEILHGLLASPFPSGLTADIVVELSPHLHPPGEFPGDEYIRQFQSLGYTAYEVVHRYDVREYLTPPAPALRPLQLPVRDLTDVLLSRRADLIGVVG